MTELSPQQRIQEERYRFPYHYLSLGVDEYRYFWHIEYLELLAAVKRLLGPLEGLRILDAGCGDGRFTYELSGEPCVPVGIDLSERAIAFARAFNPGVEFRVGDLADLTDKDRFDAAVMIDTLEHIPPEDCPRVAENVASALRPGGTLVITVPTTNIPTCAKHHRHFEEGTLIETLAPWFEPTRLEGFSRLGRARRAYQRRVKLGLALWPLRFKVPGLARYYEWLLRRFQEGFATGEPSECAWIVGVFRKRAPCE